MRFIYNIGIVITKVVLKYIAPFNAKIKLGVYGRSQTFSVLEKKITKDCKTLWFHCASLGEYEQGLPVFKALRKHYNNHKIILTFFSPSGYEIRKNSRIADVVAYLPLDSKKNAKAFLNIVKPELTVFVKYDIWPNFLLELKSRNHRAILISAAFRKSQIYFKPFTKLFKDAIFTFEHIFTQNDISKTLLNIIDYKNVTVTGDTRFDRVGSQLQMNNTLNFVSTFKGDALCVVAGSTWPEDEDLIVNYINSKSGSKAKFIIVPHEVALSRIKKLSSRLKEDVILYSEKDIKQLSDYNVLIVDVIGLLSKIYSYADIAYVGGAMGKTGLHNTLEPAVFGIPIIIGKNYRKFPEATTMIDNGGMFSVKNKNDFNILINSLINNKGRRQLSGNKNWDFVKKSKGAVIQIIDYLRI